MEPRRGSDLDPFQPMAPGQWADYDEEEDDEFRRRSSSFGRSESDAHREEARAAVARYRAEQAAKDKAAQQSAEHASSNAGSAESAALVGGDGGVEADDGSAAADGPSRSARREALPIPERPPFTVFVANVPFNLEEDDARDFFGELAGQIENMKILRHRDTKNAKGCFVEFASQEALKSALGMSGNDLKGRHVSVNVAEKPRISRAPAENNGRRNRRRNEGPASRSGSTRVDRDGFERVEQRRERGRGGRSRPTRSDWRDSAPKKQANDAAYVKDETKPAQISNMFAALNMDDGNSSSESD